MATTEETLLSLTEEAAAKIKQLIAAESDGELGVLRVAIQGGSCSGLEYGLGLDRMALEGDLAFTINGVEIVVDPFSAPYLRGATIDLVSEDGEEAFTIENPNALSSCGCGSSLQSEGEQCSESGAGCGGGCQH